MRNIFTGIIEELGVVKSIAINGASGCITIKAKKVLEGTQLGDSIAVNPLTQMVLVRMLWQRQ